MKCKNCTSDIDLKIIEDTEKIIRYQCQNPDCKVIYNIPKNKSWSGHFTIKTKGENL